MLLATAMVARAFDFSAVAPSGQTLYFNITPAGTAEVVAPSDNWMSHTAPAGRLVLPSTVTYGGTTYSVTAVANNAFRGCTGLTAVEVPGSIATIGYTAFFQCTALTSARLAEGVAELGRMAFAACGALDTIEVPHSLRQIGISAFHGTAYVAEPSHWTDSVLYIGPYAIEVSSTVVGPVRVAEGTIGLGTAAFNYCHYMHQAVLPSSLLFVGHLAFNDCEVLDTVRLLATVPPTLADDAFNVEPRPVVVVPCGSLQAYAAAPQWNLLTLVEDTCGTQGIAGTEAAHADAVAVNGGIEVRGAEGCPVAVHDVMGRCLYATNAAREVLFVPVGAEGVYVVTVGGQRPYKVLAGLK